MTVSKTSETLWLKKIPFLEGFICFGYIPLYRLCTLWRYYVDYTFGVYIFSLIIYVYVSCIIIYLGLKIQKRTLASVMIFKKVNYKILLAGLICSIGYILFSSYIQLMLLSVKYDWFDTFKEYAYYDPDRGHSILLLTIDYAIIPALIEEITFKGVIFSSLIKKKYSKITAVIITSLLFAACHFNKLMFIDHFLFSLFTFWIYFKTGNLIFPILIHFFNNFYVTATLTWDHLLDIGFLYASVILFLLGCYFFYKASENKKQNKAQKH